MLRYLTVSKDCCMCYFCLIGANDLPVYAAASYLTSEKIYALFCFYCAPKIAVYYYFIFN